jgi:hypothetical protein
MVEMRMEPKRNLKREYLEPSSCSRSYMRLRPSVHRQLGATSLPYLIAPASADVSISGGEGWLVWSVPAADGWRLETYHDSFLSSLPVPMRS